MDITGYIWREDVIDKLAWKHRVQMEEGVPLNTLINLWVQEKLQRYAELLPE